MLVTFERLISTLMLCSSFPNAIIRAPALPSLHANDQFHIRTIEWVTASPTVGFDRRSGEL
jgi:hypothetical protein